MGRERTIPLLWGLAVLSVIVALTLAGAPTPIVVALIVRLPHPSIPKRDRTQRSRSKDQKP
jgi:hypothetical protein